MSLISFAQLILTIVAMIGLLWIVVIVASKGRRDPRAVRQKLAATPYPPPRRIQGLLSHQECDRLIAVAGESGLLASKVYEPADSKVRQNHRQSEQVWVKAEKEPTLMKLSRLASELTGKDRDHQEDVQIVRYREGGFYNPHYDACEGDERHCRSFTKRGGQRYATLLIYLSDDFTGGGTHFPRLNYTAVPKKGDAIFFYSTDEEGGLYPDSQHGGQPVTKGTKWIANVWVRIKPLKS